MLRFGTSYLTSFRAMSHVGALSHRSRWYLDTTLYCAALLAKNGFEEDARKTCIALKANVKKIDHRAIKHSAILAADDDPDKMMKISKFFTQEFDIEMETMTEAQLRGLLRAKDFDGALKFATEESNRLKRAWGAHIMFMEGFKNNNVEFVKQVYNMVLNAHGKSIATLDMAFSMLISGDAKLLQLAQQLYETEGLYARDNKMNFYFSMCRREKRFDVLQLLITTFYKKNISTTHFLMDALERLCSLITRENNKIEFSLGLEQALREVDFPINTNLRQFFAGIHEEEAERNPQRKAANL